MTIPNDLRADALDVDALSQEIRRVDGNNNLGAGALAEALVPFISGAYADVVISLLDEIERLREALEPFAEGAKNVDQYHGDMTGWQPQMDDDETIDALVVGDCIKVCTLGDLRRARAALTTGETS